jgi:hypothetical protein
MIGIRKNDREEVRIAISPFQGKDRLDIREYFTSIDGDMRPSKKGISLPADQLDAVINALQALKTENIKGLAVQTSAQETEEVPF